MASMRQVSDEITRVAISIVEHDEVVVLFKKGRSWMWCSSPNTYGDGAICEGVFHRISPTMVLINFKALPYDEKVRAFCNMEAFLKEMWEM